MRSGRVPKDGAHLLNAAEVGKIHSCALSAPPAERAQAASGPAQRPRLNWDTGVSVPHCDRRADPQTAASEISFTASKSVADGVPARGVPQTREIMDAEMATAATC